ncbi:GNAT family N-acetyltransferase [Devosia sp.]|uniref:GNAT family N-acetyltransferase n=1 Tax=Devosia sp. TaxID=1871048 RepID=UPI003BA97F93
MQTRLIAFSVAALDAEERSADALCVHLEVAQPVSWPPPFNEDAVRNWFRNQLRADPALAPWLGHYVVCTIDGSETLVGTAGYKGPPDASGMVEIGYSIVPAYHRMGIGTAMVAALVRQAFADVRVKRITAETPVTFTASRGLLEKCGFASVGNRVHPEDGELALNALERA